MFYYVTVCPRMCMALIWHRNYYHPYYLFLIFQYENGNGNGNENGNKRKENYYQR